MYKAVAYNIAFTLGIIALIVLANLSILITLFSSSPLSYRNIPFTVSRSEYKQGDTFSMRVEQCSTESTAVAVVSVKELYNLSTGATVALPSGSRIIPPGCSVVNVAYTHLVPPSTPEGRYVLRGVTTFRGSFKTVDVAWQTQPFVYRSE